MPDPDYTPASRKSDLILLVLGVVSFTLFFLFLDAEEALACSMVVGVFVAIVQTMPRSQRNQTFWMTMATFAIVHVAALSILRVHELRFGLVALPFALVDGFAMWRLINWIERRVARGNGGPGSR